VVAGDVLIACQVADWGDLSSMSTPTGGATWQLLAQRSAGDEPGIFVKVWWKYAGGDEPASYGFSQDDRAFGAVAIVAVQDAKLDITPLVQQSGGTNSSTVTTPSITPAGADDLDIRIAAGTAADMSSATWSAPSQWTHRVASGEGGVGDGAGVAMATRELNSASPTGTQNYGCSETLGFWAGFSVAVASAPPPGGRPPVVSRAAVHRAASW